MKVLRFRAVVALALIVTGCGNASPSPGAGSPVITVFAAASLTEPFNDAGFDATFSFAGSQQLVAQITAGAPADVVATADQESMARLVAAGLVEPPVDFARNSLRIAVRPGNPKAVRGLGDLARSDLKVVLADPAVPAGRYARQALDKAGVIVKPVSLDLDVKSVLSKVTLGEADAGIVYATDVAAAGSGVGSVDIPSEHNVAATYPVAVVKGTKHPEAARAFVAQLLNGRGRDALLARGFLAP
jgi:molybdate transport system substrate-binding protein